MPEGKLPYTSYAECILAARKKGSSPAPCRELQEKTKNPMSAAATKTKNPSAPLKGSTPAMNSKKGGGGYV